MRIDMHTHYIPRYFVDEARRGQAIVEVRIEQQGDYEWATHPEGYRYALYPRFWDVAAKLEHMDQLGIDVSVLSVSPILFFYRLEAALAQEFCQRTNEALADFAAQSEGRLYGLATVPLQDPEAAAAELRRAVVDLGLRGAQVGARMETTPLDDPQFDPFWATAAELEAPVFLHPYRVSVPPQFADFYMVNLIGNPLETGIAASRLILSGCLDRHPKLTVVLAHGGGFMPYQIGRLDHGFRVRSETRANIDAPPSSYLRRFYYDTITHASTPLKFLVELVGADRVVLGTDIPFDMEDLNFEGYLAETGLDDHSLAAINGGNAGRIFSLD